MHVLFLREGTSFNGKEGGNVGALNEIDQNVYKRKLPFKKFRSGYTIPTISKFELVWYREKKENVPILIRDLKARMLNDSSSSWNPFKLFIRVPAEGTHSVKTGESHIDVGIGNLEDWIRYTFKLFYLFSYLVGSVYAVIRFFVSLVYLFFQPNRKSNLICNYKLLVKSLRQKYRFPIKPYHCAEGQMQPYTNKWNYIWFLGVMEDIEKFEGNEEL